jgi:hypothetical protein
MNVRFMNGIIAMAVAIAFAAAGAVQADITGLDRPYAVNIGGPAHNLYVAEVGTGRVPGLDLNVDHLGNMRQAPNDVGSNNQARNLILAEAHHRHRLFGEWARFRPWICIRTPGRRRRGGGLLLRGGAGHTGRRAAGLG